MITPTPDSTSNDVTLKSEALDIPALFVSARPGWLIVLACIFIQFLSFRQMVARDIEGIYPFSFDQTTYLRHAYEAFETIRTSGIIAGLNEAFFSPGKPNGVVLQGEAVLSYLLFGSSRATSLAVIFVHFAVLQAALFALFRKLTARNESGFLAVGLLLLTSSRYFSAGGLNDFRLDLASSSLYGVCLCALLCANLFTNRKWSFVLSVALTFQIATRFVSAAYVLPACGLVLLFLGTAMLAGTENREAATNRLRAGIICVAAACLAVLPFLWINMRDLYQYYVVGHLTGSEPAIRAAEAGVVGRLSSVLFYPMSLLTEHLGKPFVFATGFCFLFAAGSRVFSARKEPAAQLSTFKLPVVLALLWLGLPLLLFTWDTSKSHVVASVLVPPVVILAMFVCLGLLGHPLSPPVKPVRHFVFSAVAGGIFLLGLVFTLSKQAEAVPRLAEARQASDLYAVFDEIAGDIKKSGLTRPLFATDRNVDYFNGSVAKVMIYERTGRLVDSREVLAIGVMAVSKDAALRALAQADYALITLDHPAAARSFVYPFDQGMFAYRNDLLRHANAQMIPLRRIQMDNHLFQIYARPHLQQLGVSGGWLPHAGFRLRADTGALRRFSHVLLSGPTMQSGELREGLQCNAYFVAADSGRRKSLRTSARLGNDSYAIEIDATPARDAPGDFVEIELEFPTYFIPKERGINSDERKLVVSAPQSVRLLSATPSSPASEAPLNVLPKATR